MGFVNAQVLATGLLVPCFVLLRVVLSSNDCLNCTQDNYKIVRFFQVGLVALVVLRCPFAELKALPVCRHGAWPGA